MDPSYFILAAIICSIVLVQVNQRMGSPVIAIFVRWLRWIVFGTGFAYMCVDFDLINRPFWVLTLVFLLVWFLC